MLPIRNALIIGFCPPFSRDDYAPHVVDAEGNLVIQVRGWGHLCKAGTASQAVEIQDSIADGIANYLNKCVENDKQGHTQEDAGD